jgi:hypothetical protein
MNLYNILIYSWYIFFALSKLGLWGGADAYLDKSAYYLKIYIAVMLLYYFNPLRRIEYTRYHKSMVMTAAIFIIITSTFTEFFSRALGDTIDIKDKVFGLVPQFV